MATIANDRTLLDALIADGDKAQPPWQVTAYWSGYQRRIAAELERSGLADLRTNYRLLKGFALGGVPEPTLPASPLKRRIFQAIETAPGARKVVGEYRRLLKAQQKSLLAAQKSLASLVLDRIAERHPDLRLPAATPGNGADHLVWREREVAAALVPYLARAADFYAVVAPREVTSMMEVGPGLGLSTLAHLALNPNLRLVVNLDIPSTLYISTQFLKAVDGPEVVDYLSVREASSVALSPGNGGAARVYQLPPWLLDRVTGSVDWIHSAFAFQEMEREVAAAYLAAAKRLGCRGAWLMSMVEGHKPGAGGQTAPVTFADLERALQPEFHPETEVQTALSGLYGVTSAVSRIYRAG
jgi:putative sugar O-methyltransferase